MQLIDDQWQYVSGSDGERETRAPLERSGEAGDELSQHRTRRLVFGRRRRLLPNAIGGRRRRLLLLAVGDDDDAARGHRLLLVVCC